VEGNTRRDGDYAWDEMLLLRDKDRAPPGAGWGRWGRKSEEEEVEEEVAEEQEVD